MKVALVHEHLAQDGGAERVVRHLMDLYPKAPLHTLVYNPDHAHPEFRGRDIRTSFLQRMPGGVRFYQWYVNWMPNAIERFDFTGYDVVISSASAFAKGIITSPKTLHICYLHSPTRYLWSDTHTYVQELAYPKFVKAFIPFSLTKLRLWDRLAAERVDHFIANSRTVQHRIKKYYQHQSQVIYPPVDLDRYAVKTKPGQYFLTGGRLVPYKRFELAVQAFNRMGLPLKIYGTGPTDRALREMAKPNVEFLGRVPDDQMNELYQNAIAFINPQEEDFGLTAVEAMATGTPVIAFRAGGALESVKPGETGVFFDDQEWESLADCVIRFRPEQFSPATIRAWAMQFGVERFKQEFSQAVEQTWQAYRTQVP